MSVRAVPYRGSVQFEVRDIPGAHSYFVLGVRKSGSSILNSIVEALAVHNGLNYIDVAGRLFERGITVPDWQRDSSLAAILAPGNVYGGFRDAPKPFYGVPLFESAQKLLLVRDPRDALVSEYFSNAYSHSIPDDGENRGEMLRLRASALSAEIEDYVLERAQWMRATLADYKRFVHDPMCAVFRYEDIIFKKAEFIRAIASRFGWNLPEELCRNIVSWADVVPTVERPTEFVRRVTPGDHREKLSSATIDKLNAILADELRAFGYAA